MKKWCFFKRIALFCAALLAVLVVLPLVGCTAKAESIAFQYQYYRVKVGETISPVVQITPEGAPFELKTEFDGIAVLDAGSVKGVNPGVTLLTVTSGDLTAFATVEVVHSGGGSHEPGGDKIQVFYVIDEENSSYFINTVTAGSLATDISLGRDGYNLKGWYADAKFKTLFDFSVPITKTVKIYGKFDPVQGDQTPLEYKTIGNSAVEVTGLTYPKVPYTEIEIPQNTKIRGITYAVTQVADDAFKNNKTLVSVTMNHIQSIGNSAFYGCTNLANLNGQKVSEVYENAFTGTKWLNEESKRSFTVFGKNYYHGAQLGGCYIYADEADAIYLFENADLHAQVTSFAAASVMKKTLIYVPDGLYEYYRNFEELKELKNNIKGYQFQNGQLVVTRQ